MITGWKKKVSDGLLPSFPTFSLDSLLVGLSFSTHYFLSSRFFTFLNQLLASSLDSFLLARSVVDFFKVLTFSILLSGLYLFFFFFFFFPLSILSPPFDIAAIVFTSTISFLHICKLLFAVYRSFYKPLLPRMFPLIRKYFNSPL